MSQEIYYKATLANGVSGYDSKFIYHLGLNVHPNPDKNSKGACGIGIHLAKTVAIAREYVSGAKEIYEAKAGVILGEDEKKVRCSSCTLIRLIEACDITLPRRPSLNDEWVDKHYYDITLEDINSQTLEIAREGESALTVSLKMRKEDRKTIIKYAVGGK